MVKARTRVLWLMMRLWRPGQLRRLRLASWARPLSGLLDRGRLQILGGIGVNLQISAAHFPYWETQAFGVLAGTHEPMVQEALRRSLPAGGTFLDLGSNIGATSLIGARLVGPTGRVIAVDAQRECATASAANARAAGMFHIEVVHAAVTDRSGGTTEVIVTDETLWTRLASVAEAGPVHEARRDQVPCLSVDDLAETHRLDRVDAVKIDIEGAELLALAGMTGVLRRHRPAVICEMHGRNAEFASFMRRHDYAVVNLDGPEPLEDADDNAHAIALPR